MTFELYWMKWYHAERWKGLVRRGIMLITAYLLCARELEQNDALAFDFDAF